MRRGRTSWPDHSRLRDSDKLFISRRLASGQDFPSLSAFNDPSSIYTRTRTRSSLSPLSPPFPPLFSFRASRRFFFLLSDTAATVQPKSPVLRPREQRLRGGRETNGLDKKRPREVTQAVGRRKEGKEEKEEKEGFEFVAGSTGSPGWPALSCPRNRI